MSYTDTSGGVGLTPTFALTASLENITITHTITVTITHTITRIITDTETDVRTLVGRYGTRTEAAPRRNRFDSDTSCHQW